VLKLFDEDVSGDAVRRSRFEWEAATLAGLAHPNVLPILDYGVFAGRRYLVSEWIEGESLAQRMRRSQLPLTTAVGIIRQILAALASVHAARLAHRNLKPTDVYLEWRKQGRERVKLLDFAPVIRPRPGVPQRGSYVPPEFAAGEPLDARSDVFAVGALLSALLHGGPPDVPALARPTAPGARKGPVVDSTLQGWIRRAMARDPQDRFGDAAEMLQQLIDLLPRDLRSPPEGFEAARVSTVGLPSPIRSDTRRDPLRAETSRSQTMRVDNLNLPISTEPRVEPARVESEPRPNPVLGATKELVSPQTREAFARSERARAFIEARAKGRPRTQTPAQGSGPRPESPRASTTSAGWFIAEPARRGEALESDTDFEPSRVGAEAPARDSETNVAKVGVDLEVAPAWPAVHASPPVASLPTAADRSVERAIDAITIDVDIEDDEPIGAAPITAAGMAATPAPAAEPAAAPQTRADDTLQTRERDATKTAISIGRARTANSVKPPNRKARREAARLARERDATASGLTIPGVELADAGANATKPEPEVARERHAEDPKHPKPARLVTRISNRPRTADEGRVRDAVVGSVSRWFARLSRNSRFTPSLGHASLVGAGIVCVLALSVVGLRSLDARENTSGPGTVQTAVDETSAPLTAPRATVAIPGPGRTTPETTLAPATTSTGEALAAESGDSDRVPAINPWNDPLPPELDGIPALADKGDKGDDATMQRLREYSRYNPDDPRGYLLIGRLYMNRYWRADALNQFQAAIDHDPAARGAPEIMRALLDLIVTGKATEEAEAFLLRVYRREALPAIEAELEKLQRPMSINRLSAVRSKLLDS
jgi:serine/threonine protein kinase